MAIVLALATAAALPTAALAKRAPSRLRAFSSCPELVGYAKGHFAQTKGAPAAGVTPLAEPGHPRPRSDRPTPRPRSRRRRRRPTRPRTSRRRASTSPTWSRPTARRSSPSPGTRSYAVAATGPGAPRITGSLKLGRSGGDLLLHGHAPARDPEREPPHLGRAGRRRRAPPRARAGSGQTLLTEVDVSDPAALKVARTLTLDGQYVNARQNGAHRARRALLDAAGLHGRRRARPRVGLAAALALRLADLRAPSHADDRRLPRGAPAADVLGARDGVDPHHRPGQGPVGGRRRRGHDRRADGLRLDAATSTSRPSAGSIRRPRRATCRRPRRSSTASTSPIPTAPPTRPAARSPATCSTSTRSPSRAATCAWPRPPSPSGGRARSRARQPELRDGAAPAGRDARPHRPRLGPGQGAAHLLGALHRRRRLRRDLPPGRSALHDRPGRPDRAEASWASSSCSATRPTCTRSPTACCSASARTRRPRAAPRACRCRSSASATRRIRSCWPSTRWARRRRRRSSSTATPSSTGPRGSSSCCRCRSTTRATASVVAGLHRRGRADRHPVGDRRGRPGRPRPGRWLRPGDQPLGRHRRPAADGLRRRRDGERRSTASRASGGWRSRRPRATESRLLRCATPKASSRGRSERWSQRPWRACRHKHHMDEEDRTRLRTTAARRETPPASLPPR